MKPLVIFVVSLFNQVCCFAVIHLLGFDAQTAIQSLKRNFRSAARIQHIGKPLHFSMLINANELLVLQLVGIQRVELWSEMIINRESISVGVNCASKLLKRCGNIYASINQHVCTRFKDRLWSSRCSQEGAVFPRRVGALQRVAESGNSEPLGGLNDFPLFLWGEVEHAAESVYAVVMNGLFLRNIRRDDLAGSLLVVRAFNLGYQ